MKLFVLRHAQAEDNAPDRERKLTLFGEAQIKDLCSKINKDSLSNVAHVWHSPYVRAAQTAHIFCRESGLTAPMLAVNNATPSDSPVELARTISGISRFGSDLLLVTHNPFAERLADLLLCCKKGCGVLYFKKCTLACFQLEDDPTPDYPYGRWALSMLVSPTIEYR